MNEKMDNIELYPGMYITFISIFIIYIQRFEQLLPEHRKISRHKIRTIYLHSGILHNEDQTPTTSVDTSFFPDALDSTLVILEFTLDLLDAVVLRLCPRIRSRNA